MARKGFVGRIIDLIPVHGGYFPQNYTGNLLAQAQSLTYSTKFYARGDGEIVIASVIADITGTVTFDIKKNGSSVLSGAATLTDDTKYKLRGFGATGVAANYFNTDSAANRAKLKYTVDDLIQVDIITAAASTVVTGTVTLHVDEEQPVKPGY